MWRLNKTLPNNGWINKEIKGEVKRYLETNQNQNTTCQNLWDTAKAVLRGKFVALKAYVNKQEKCQINNLTVHLKELKLEGQSPKSKQGRK